MRLTVMTSGVICTAAEEKGADVRHPRHDPARGSSGRPRGLPLGGGRFRPTRVPLPHKMRVLGLDGFGYLADDG